MGTAIIAYPEVFRGYERSHLRNNGTGSWAIVEKETTTIVGTILLLQFPDKDSLPTQDYEVGWHLGRASWGKGYATEARQVMTNDQ